MQLFPTPLGPQEKTKKLIDELAQRTFDCLCMYTAMKCDKMSGGFESEDLRTSHKQGLCCFRRNYFEFSGDITLKLH